MEKNVPDKLSRPKGWDIISELLRDVRPPLSLQKLLETVLDKLHSLPWLKTENRGAILLIGSNEKLILVASHNYSDGRTAYCEQVDRDRCGCGEVVCTRKVAFMPCEGEDRFGTQGKNHVITPLLDGDKILGVMPLFVPDGHETTEAEIVFLQDLSYALSSIISRLLMEEIVQVKQLELEETKAEALQKLGVASEYRDSETGMHVMRMAYYANSIAKEMGIPDEDREHLLVAAPMHDVGKIGIPDSIMLKPGRLTEKEYTIMKDHCQIGARILNGNDNLMKTAHVIAMSHHEKWDGSGYPNGTKGEDIPILGRICAVADVFDALTSKRPYKEAWSVEKSLKLIEDDAGKAFDPMVVNAFKEALPSILRIKEIYRDDIIDPHEKLELPPLPEPGNPWIPWDDALSIGIDVVDEHHRYLFKLINDLYTAVTDNHGCRAVAQTLQALEQYTLIHFREEERMMSLYNYTRLNEHTSQHNKFCDNIAKARSELIRNPLTLGRETLLFLRSWLTNHIMKEDALLHQLSTTNSPSH
ncbi:MAG: bacteriohemerythrin [Rhodospirillales bacterium]|nr:bacteriohemerythrin [Rhodospirillales bacterium]